MRVFKNRWFQRFARAESIDDDQLCEAAAALGGGQGIALGGAVFKQRIARRGGKKRAAIVL